MILWPAACSICSGKRVTNKKKDVKEPTNKEKKSRAIKNDEKFQPFGDSQDDSVAEPITIEVDNVIKPMENKYLEEIER